MVEAPEFWRNLDVATVDGDWLNAAAVLVLPAWVEHWPRRLIRAAAAGIPVIASSACGLSGIPNVQECQPGDVDGLVSHLSAVLRRIPA